MKLYHGTFEDTLDLDDETLDFCLTEEFEAAYEYATDLGDDGFVHEYRFSGNVADESDARQALGLDEWDDLVVALDRHSGRQSIVDAGFDAVEFGDTTNGGRSIVTVRVFTASTLRLVDTHIAEF